MRTSLPQNRDTDDAAAEEEKRFDLSEGASPKAAPALSAPRSGAADGLTSPAAPMPEAASDLKPALIGVGVLSGLSLLTGLLLAVGLRGWVLGLPLLAGSVVAAVFVFRQVTAAQAALDGALQSAAERESQTTRQAAAQAERAAGILAALEGVSDAAFVTDAKGRITSLNGAAVSLTGLTPPEALGRDIASTVRLVNADSGRDLEAPTALTLKQFLTVTTLPQTALRGRDGHSLPVEGVSAPVWDVQGKLAGATLVLRSLRDVPPLAAPASDAELQGVKAELLAAQAELREIKTRGAATRSSREAGDRERAEQTRLEAEGLRQDRSRFLAEISNELRTPLNAVLGYTELLKEQAEDQNLEDLIPDLGRIQEGGTHLLSLVNDLVNLSRLEAGQVDLFTESCDVAALVDEVAQAISPVLERNANRLVVDCPADIGSLQTDRGKLRQSLLYLLSATGRFTTQRALELDAVRRREPDGREWIVFRVADRGSSLPATPGTSGGAGSGQLASATAIPSSSASGVGLEISRRFCQMLGGDLSVTSESGRGTVFTLTLPATQPT